MRHVRVRGRVRKRASGRPTGYSTNQIARAVTSSDSISAPRTSALTIISFQG